MSSLKILQFKTDTLDITRDSPSDVVGLAPDLGKEVLTDEAMRGASL